VSRYRISGYEARRQVRRRPEGVPRDTGRSYSKNGGVATKKTKLTRAAAKEPKTTYKLRNPERVQHVKKRTKTRLSAQKTQPGVWAK